MTRALRHFALALLATSCLVAAPAVAAPAVAVPAPTPQTRDAASALHVLFSDYESWSYSVDPVSAGFDSGDIAVFSRVPDNSPAADARRTAALKGFRDRLAAIDRSALTGDDLVNADFFRWVLDGLLDLARFDDARLGLGNEGGPVTDLRQVADVTRLATVEEARAYIARLRGSGAYVRQATENARRGIRTGFTQSRETVLTALPQLRREADAPIDSDRMMAPFASLPATIPAATRADLTAQGRAAIETVIKPAERDFLRMVETEYLPKARKGLGVGSLPDGQAYYAALARFHTTTTMTPAELHALGLSEVKRIRAEMEAVIAETGFKGDFAAFLNFLRTDPQFYARSRQELLEKASEVSKRADGGLPKIFGTLPRLSYGVRAVDPSIEETYTTGRYVSGSMRLGVSGTYLVNTSHLDQRPLYELPALTLHEAVPGHHLQIALTQELGDQPYFRRTSIVTAYQEGWGLYSEYLGYDLNMYRTPYERFGKLSYEMWRACRLVSDTGIHALGWSLDEARRCFTENTALAPHNIETELQRYVSQPGQALAYKVGELKIRELRKRAEAALGERFDLRAFHDAILVNGPVPMGLLEARIDAWIAARKGQK